MLSCCHVVRVSDSVLSGSYALRLSPSQIVTLSLSQASIIIMVVMLITTCKLSVRVLVIIVNRRNR